MSNANAKPIQKCVPNWNNHGAEECYETEDHHHRLAGSVKLIARIEAEAKVKAKDVEGSSSTGTGYTTASD